MVSRSPDATAVPGGRPMVRVWDIFVRVFHWTVVVTFFVAYFTEDDLLTLHVWAGYVLGAFVVMRVLWGFVGPKHARFTDFVRGPVEVWTYLLDLVAFRARRHIGHSPAGGAMVVALMIGLLAVVWTGLELYAVEENAGPLASVSTAAAAPGLLVLVSDDDDGDENDEAEEFWEDLHESLSNIVFVLVVLHIAGVLLASIVHRENLARAMVTGLKRPED